MSGKVDNFTEKKAHRERRAGRKSDRKKKKKSTIVQDITDVQRNPKAFSFNSAIKAERHFRRKQDIQTKKQHIPLIDRSAVEPPPILIAVVGPPKVGKSTLINSMIKLFTKSPMTDVKGPITIVTGKKRRITLIECTNNINCMIDLAKVADLVLLLCDASFGFEIEVFEFLNICQVHGMPRVMGVLTHLDLIKNNKTLKNTKKILKHRFWTEVYPGAKLFYLSGVLHGEYLNNEIKNLGRFISVIKLRPITWRINHSYLIADRYEDLTNQEIIRKNPKCDRTISLYGYIRGIPFNKNSSVHIAGLGDLQVHDMSHLPDPCPLPETIKKRALVEKEKLLYAPFSGVGGIVYDKDAVYVELGGSHSHIHHKNNESSNIVSNLISTKETLDTKLKYSELQLFTKGEKLTAKDFDDETMAENENNEEKEFSQSDYYLRDPVDIGETESEYSENDNKDLRKVNLMKLVYGVFEGELKLSDKRNTQGEESGIGGLFKLVCHDNQKQHTDQDKLIILETSLFEPPNMINWIDAKNKILIKNSFVTGKWKESEDAAELLKLDDTEINSDSEIFGDFEDIETGQKYKYEDKINSEISGKRKLSTETESKEALTEKKLKLKEKFDTEYDNNEKSYYDDMKTNMEKQSNLNKTVFDKIPDDIRVQIEGYRSGMYVRLEFQDVAAEFVNNFDPTYPIIIGSLNVGEQNIGYVNVKFKKHRWYNKILKSNDSLIFSLGWRRFQTLPTFSKLEDDLKFRYLKYTPQHVTCNAHFWGPITPQGTGILALQSCEENNEFVKQSFRIAATGVVQELDKSTKIMKKLKLIGYPLKIYKKTAFIKDMFSSALEVAQFEGARIKTVSGIRGQIKKPVSKPEGCFRATFEDKIQLSDIVFCKTWFKVTIPHFYNPITTLLLPSEQKNSWRGIRTIGQIKREEGLANIPNQNSLYQDIQREPKIFKPLIIPSKLQHALPYRDKPKYGVLPKNKKESDVERIAVVREPYEQQVSHMMKTLRTSFEHKQAQLKLTMKENLKKHREELEQHELHKQKKLKQKKKMVMRLKSKMS